MLASQGVYGLASRWGWVVFRGVAAILFGLLAFARPGAIGVGLVLLFAGYAFVSGVATVVSAARSGRAGEPHWWMMLVEGLLSIAVAVIAAVWPARTALAFIWVIGAWAVVTGALGIVSGIRLRKMIEGEWALILSGVLSVIFGLLMLYRPLAGGLAIIWWLGAYFLVFGIAMIVVGLRLRSVDHAHRGGHLPPAEGLHLPG